MFRKRRFRRRRPFRRIRRRIRRIPRTRRGDATRFFKIRTNVPLAAITQAQTTRIGDTISAVVGNYSALAAIFSHVKVCAIGLKWHPAHVSSDIATPNRYLPIYLAHDKNLSAPVSISVDDMLQYHNLRTFNVFRPFKYYRKMGHQLLLTNLATSSTTYRGFHSTQNPIPITQNILIHVPGFANASQLGQFIVTYYIAARNVR